MEKVSYKLLKKLYREGKIDKDSANEFTKHKSRNSNNPYVSYLMSEKLIALSREGGKPDGAGGLLGGVEYIRITLLGREYVEHKRKDLIMFWVPYGITTALAIASLVVAIAALSH